MKKLQSKKDYIKLIRGTIEGIILLCLLIIIIKSIFVSNKYESYEKLKVPISQNDNGFIALSYFGVNRIGSQVVISTERLEEQLKLLYENGYVTITQQDVIDYYTKGKKLPERALFLMFEDGFKGTAIFAQKIMEKYNFKATILTYPEKFNDKDPKFLLPKDLKELVKSTFWELGTNGYRLSYINVFDEEQNYIGELDSVEFTTIRDKLGRDYNHYLMDYIRDENGIPKESYTEMKNRINTDYELLQKSYEKGLGYVPQLHVLMHANTEAFGNNKKVSDINEKNIKEVFKINYNREGYSLNDKEANLYDLTRMQPQAYWYPNHLLMRIQDDTNSNVEFEYGDKERMKYWKQIKGATEFSGDIIAVTSLPKDTGLIALDNGAVYKDFKLSVNLKGNAIGSQAIYLRGDEELNNYIKVQIVNNVLLVLESIDGKENKLYEQKLKLEGFEDDSKIQINTEAYRELKIQLVGESLSIKIDDEEVVDDLKVNILHSGLVYLESSWGEYGYSQRNLTDDVYDGVFEKLYIRDYDTNKLLYDNRYKGLELLKNKAYKMWENTVNWFIENL